MPTSIPQRSQASQPHDHASGLLVAADALLPTAPGRALELAREALTLAASLDHQLEAQAHCCAGQALHRLAQFGDAHTALVTAAQLYQRGGNLAGEAACQLTLAKINRERGELAAAEDALVRALLLARHTGDQKLEADVLNQQAVLLQIGGHSEQALARFHDSLALHEALDDAVGTAQVLSNIGQVHLSLGHHGEALATLNRASHLLGLRDEPLLWAQCLMSIAHVYEDLDDWPQAHQSHQRAHELARTSGNRLVELYALNNLAGAAFQLGRHGEAQTLGEATLAGATEVGQRYLAGVAHHGLGQTLGAGGHWNAALAHHQQALAIATELEDPGSEVDARLGLGEAHLRRGEVFVAAEQLTRTLPLAQQIGQDRSTARIHGLLADALERSGDLRAAIGHLNAQRTIEQTLVAEGRDRHTRLLTMQFDVERSRHETEVERLRTETAQRAYVQAEAKVEKRTRDLARTQIEVLTRLANAAEFRDDVTGEHTLRVGEISAMLAAQLGQQADEVALIRLAARLHDVGKIGISDLILLKPDRLTPEEFERMKDHTRIGGEILAGGDSRLLKLARDIALYHHERWAGSGYPHGLAGDAIPLSARIVAVADVYDALSHQRPYKRPWSVPEVLAELRRQSGLHFDPDIVEAMESLHRAGRLPLRTIHTDDRDVVEILMHPGDVEDAVRSVRAEVASEDVLGLRLRHLQSSYEQARTEISSLQEAAFSDPLTGLANRRAFEADLATELIETERHHRHLSVLSLDLDGLKAINDAHGHERGDALLHRVGQTLQAACAPFGRLYRLGGDEFALIVPWAGEPRLDELTTQVQRAMAQVRGGGFPHASASSGHATYPDDATSAPELVHHSDRRMYQHKAAQRGSPQPALH